MSQENNSESVAETRPLSEDNSKPASTNFDEQPIGGGNKFQFSQYPAENEEPPVRKIPPPRKPVKAKKEQAKKKVEEVSVKNSQPLDQIPVGGNNAPSAFDQKPIGQTSNPFNISQFPEGQQAEPVKTNYTISQKLKSKAPKLRLEGLSDLLQLLTNDPQHEDVMQISMPGLLKQTAPANVQKSLQCLKAWMKCGKNWGQDEAKNAMQSGFINGKPNTKKLTIQIVDEMYEVKPDMVEMLLLLGFKNKVPKVIAGYNSILNQLLAIYGIRKMKYLKPYLSEVVRVIGAEKLAAVKTEGMNTLRQAYKWMGKETVEPMLGNLKQALKKELDNEWENYDKTIVMTAPKDTPEQGAGKSKGKKIDAYDLSEAVDIFKKYNEKWSDSVIRAEKWIEKKDMMTQFVKAATVPKLANTQTRHITQLIRRLINDSNMNVVIWTLKVAAVMAKGLRKHFHGAAKSQFFNVISKFREKKTQMIQQTFATLNEFNHCLSIEDVMQDVKEGLNDKAPTMRCNLLNWIGKHIQQKTEEKGGQTPEKTKDAIKKLFPIFQKLLEDGVADVRDTMAKNLAKIQMIIGQDFFASIKGKVSKKMASKIDAKIQKQQAQHDRSSKKAQPDLSKSGVSLKGPKANESKIMANKSSVIEKQKEKEKEKKQEKQQKIVLESYDEPYFDQSLQTLIGLGFPEEEVKNVAASSANDRGKILVYLRQNPYENFNAVLRVIKKAFKDWKEVNLKMNKDLIVYLQERVADIGKPESYLLIPYIAQKIGDSKFSEQLYNLIISICERVPAKFLIGHFIRYVKSPQNKKPKINGDVCNIIIKIIETVSIVNVHIKDIVQYAKETYAVPFSKKGAQELLINLYMHVGESLKTMIDDSIAKALDGEFRSVKVLSEEQKKPKVEFEAQAAVQSQTVVKKSTVTKSDGKPRDLSFEVQKALPLMNDNSNWQKRKEGAEILSSQLEFGGKVSFGNGLNDLLSTLKAHINDTNKQLIKVFVHLSGLVLVSIPDKDVKVNLRNFILSMVEGLSDKNEQTRNEIVNTLGRIADSLGKEHILSNLGTFLEGGKEGRLEVLHLILIHEDGIQKADIRDYPKGLVTCLCDRNNQIRKTAQKVLQKVQEKLGLQVFRTIAKDQRPAVAKDLNILFDKLDRNAGTSSSFYSKGVSPGKASEKEPVHKQRNTLTQPPHPPSSAKKRSLSRNAPGRSFIDDQEDPHAATVTGQFFNPKQTKVEGDDLFANTKVLINQRVERMSNEGLYVWRLDQIKQMQEESVRTDLEGLIKEEIVKKLFSMEYHRVLQGVSVLMRASKDQIYQPHLKELFDVLLKWILMRLWGGQPAFSQIIQLVFPLLSILQKKKAALTDFEVDLVIAVIRQYLTSTSTIGIISDTLYSIIRCLVPLSSGQRVLKKVLRQFSLDLTSLHRHVRKDSNAFYRQALCRLIKKELADHVGNEDTLQEASKIRQLKEDPEFVNMLFRRFHQDVLRCFGFKKLDGGGMASQNRSQVGFNDSGIAYKPPLPNHSHPTPSHPQSSVGNNSHVNETRDRSGDRLPAAGHPNTMSQDLRPSQLPGKPLDRKSNLSQNQIGRQLPSQTPPAPPTPSGRNSNQASFTSSQMVYQATTWADPYDCNNLDLSIYPAPHPASPLSKHLNKLTPPNDSIINFFNTLFQQSGEKIANELAANAKIIFGSILKSIQELLSNRKDYTPQKIVAQIQLLQNCIKCSHIVKNIAELLGFGTQFALTQLVYEDQHKTQIYEELRSRNIEYKADNFIKAINGVMLRLLQNANPQQIVSVLLQLLAYHSKINPNSAKTISLVVKCIGRASKDFMKEFHPQHVKGFLIRAIQYLNAIEFDGYLETLDITERQRNRVKPQEQTANSIKVIIIEICKAIGSQVWQHYQKAITESQFQDKWINIFISSLNVRLPQRTRGRSQNSKENEQLKKINQLLSKNKSYESGISMLKKYTEKHPEFNAEEYFTSLNYDKKFIQMVVGALDGQRKSYSRADSRQHEAPQSIQDRIKRLKERFQELQPQDNQPNPPNNKSISRGKPGQDDQREERQMEIRRRIEEMKNKMNSAVRNR